MLVRGYSIIKGFLFSTKKEAVQKKSWFESPMCRYRVFRNRHSLYRLGYRPTSLVKEITKLIYNRLRG